MEKRRPVRLPLFPRFDDDLAVDHPLDHLFYTHISSRNRTSADAMIDSALEILYVYILGVINQQAIGYAADVVCMYVCVCAPFIYVGGWVRYVCV